jgi:hypothetical protein
MAFEHYSEAYSNSLRYPQHLDGRLWESAAQRNEWLQERRIQAGEPRLGLIVTPPAEVSTTALEAELDRRGKRKRA